MGVFDFSQKKDFKLKHDDIKIKVSVGVNSSEKRRLEFVKVERLDNGGKVYVYRDLDRPDARISSSESPEKYNKRKTLEEIKEKFANISIKYKGVDYDLDKLNKMHDEISNIIKREKNELPDIEVDADLDEEQLKKINDWKTKMAANSWKSLQRSLRKKGKLEQYKIDSLNKLGMLWNPKEDEWEKKYLIFKDNGLCNEIELWVKKQRKLFQNNEILNENLFRLQALNFPFISSKNEEFRFTSNSIWELKNKLFAKQAKLELQEKKNRGVLEIKKKRKGKLSKKELLLKKSRSEVNSFYNRKYHFCHWEFVQKLSIEESVIKIAEIEKGNSLQRARLKEFYDKESNKYKSEGRKIPSFIRRSFSEINTVKLSANEKYIELSNFIGSKINPVIRKIACQQILKYISNRNLNNSQSFKEINYLISVYKKEKNVTELLKLKDFVEQYPLLIELYFEKINKILFKFT